MHVCACGGTGVCVCSKKSEDKLGCVPQECYYLGFGLELVH